MNRVAVMKYQHTVFTFFSQGPAYLKLMYHKSNAVRVRRFGLVVTTGFIPRDRL